MKKFLSLLLAGLFTISMVGCGGESSNDTSTTDTSTDASQDHASASTETSGQTSTEGDITVNVILKTMASEYWGYVVAGAEGYAKDHPNVKVEVQGASSETAYDEQLNIIETNLSSAKYDGFVIAPLQADMVSSLISNAQVPIIAVDTKINSDKVLSFVGTGNEEAAIQGAKAAYEMAKSLGWTEFKAISISGVEGDSTAMTRLEGYQKGIEESGGEFLKDEIQYADAVADKAYSSMEAIIQNHPEGIAMILCNNDDMAIAAARAAKGKDAYANTVFLGFDGIQSACTAILNDEETMSIAQEAYQMGYLAVENCVKAIQGETIDAFIDSGSKVITKDNAQQQLDDLKQQLGAN